MLVIDFCVSPSSVCPTKLSTWNRRVRPVQSTCARTNARMALRERVKVCFRPSFKASFELQTRACTSGWQPVCTQPSFIWTNPTLPPWLNRLESERIRINAISSVLDATSRIDLRCHVSKHDTEYVLAKPLKWIRIYMCRGPYTICSYSGEPGNNISISLRGYLSSNNPPRTILLTDKLDAIARVLVLASRIDGCWNPSETQRGNSPLPPQKHWETTQRLSILLEGPCSHWSQSG